MKNIFSIAFLLIAVCFFSQVTYSQVFPYHLYKNRTLLELDKINSGNEKIPVTDTTNLMIGEEPFYSAVRLEYAGKSHKLSVSKLALFKYWAEVLDVGSANTKSDFLSIIETEYLFRECDQERWITVSTPAANDLPKDLKDGDMITLYLMMVGGIETKGESEYIYLANSFRVY